MAALRLRCSFDPIVASDGTVRLKTYCYALRAALALRWVRSRSEAPPMDLPSLLAGLTLPDGVLDTANDLVIRKRNSTERDATRRIAALDTVIGETLEAPVERSEPVPRGEVVARVDALFASIVLDDPSPFTSRAGAADR